MSLFRKINLALGALALAIFAMAFIQYRGFTSVKEQTSIFLKEDMPTTTQSVRMQNEISDMQVNLLTYMEGDGSQDTGFETNALQFKYYRNLIPKSKEQTNLAAIDTYFQNFITDSRKYVFKEFNPEEYAKSHDLAQDLALNVGVPLNELVQGLVKEEIEDAGSSGNLEDIINDDIPGIVVYSTLRNSVRNMLGSLDRFILGDTEAKKTFFEHSLIVKEQLILLRKLETRPYEVVRLDELDRLTDLLLDRGEDIFSKFSNVSKESAQSWINHITVDVVNPMIARLDNTSETSEKGMEAKIGFIDQLSSKTILIINISSIISILTVILLTLYIRNSVITPMKEVVEIVRKIRNREQNWTPERSERKDEIGELFNSLADLQSELSTLEKMREDHMKSFEEEHMSKLRAAYDEVKANETSLKTQSEHINAMNKELEQFVHIASHDLREPVKILLGYCEMLKVKAAGILDAPSLMLLEKIESSGVRMAQLIDDLRMLTKLSQDNIPKETRSIKKIVESIISDYSEKLNSRHATISIGNLPTMNCYPVFVWQLFENLVRNTIVHGPEKLEISVYSEMRDNEKVIIYSNNSDKDLEISDEFFLPFKRGKETKKDGSGIGLSICKKIVELHGGRIWFDKSNPHKFTVCFILREE